MSSTWLYDIRIEKGNKQTLPQLPVTNASCLLCVFNGKIMVNDDVELTKGKSIIEERKKLN